jgi:hypothetical protein
MVLECEADTYASAASEPLDTSLQALVESSKEELQDRTDFDVVAYDRDATSFAVADEQLSGMESYAYELYRSAEIRAEDGKQVPPANSGSSSDKDSSDPESVHESTEKLWVRQLK